MFLSSEYTRISFSHHRPGWHEAAAVKAIVLAMLVATVAGCSSGSGAPANPTGGFLGFLGGSQPVGSASPADTTDDDFGVVDAGPPTMSGLTPTVTSAPNSTVGTVQWSPSTVDCSKPVDLDVRVILPSSVEAGALTTNIFDDSETTTTTVEDESDVGTDQTWGSVTIGRQTDGSWLIEEHIWAAYLGSTMCTTTGGSWTAGRHHEVVEDSTGAILAEGWYTFER